MPAPATRVACASTTRWTSATSNARRSAWSSRCDRNRRTTPAQLCTVIGASRTQLKDHEVRKAFEEELLVAEAADTLEAYIESIGITRKELARRLEVSQSRVTQLLSGGRNITLRSVAAAAWAVGLRFRLEPCAAEREGTPAELDPTPPSWLYRFERRPQVMWRTAVPAVHPVMPDVPTMDVTDRALSATSAAA